jgi:hypothetical protein
MHTFPDGGVGSGHLDRASVVCRSMYELLLIRRTQFLAERSLLLLYGGPSVPSLWAALLPT